MSNPIVGRDTLAFADLRDSRRQRRLDLPSSSRGYRSLRRPRDPCIPIRVVVVATIGVHIVAPVLREPKTCWLAGRLPVRRMSSVRSRQPV